MKHSLPLLCVAATLFLGCATHPLGTLGAQDATLSLMTVVRDGEFRTQAGLQLYTKASINHLVLKLYTLTGQNQDVETPVVVGGSPLQADIGASDLDRAVTFGSLHSGTKYRVKAFAYKAAGTSGADLISSQDAGSYVDVSVGTSLSPTLASVPVRLIDQLFKGLASGSVVVTDGGLVNGSETFTATYSATPTPAPTPTPTPTPVPTPVWTPPIWTPPPPCFDFAPMDGLDDFTHMPCGF